MGAGSIWDISVPSPQFCCELQTAFKNILIKHNNIKEIYWEGWYIKKHPMNLYGVKCLNIQVILEMMVNCSENGVNA